jgi:hypothetical protein
LPNNAISNWNFLGLSPLIMRLRVGSAGTASNDRHPCLITGSNLDQPRTPTLVGVPGTAIPIQRALQTLALIGIAVIVMVFWYLLSM